MVWLPPLNQRPHHITNTSKDQNWPLSKEERKTLPLSRLIYCFQSIRWPASPLYSSQSVCLSVSILHLYPSLRCLITTAFIIHRNGLQGASQEIMFIRSIPVTGNAQIARRTQLFHQVNKRNSKNKRMEKMIWFILKSVRMAELKLVTEGVQQQQ